MSFTINAPEFFNLQPGQLLTGIVTTEYQSGRLHAVFYGPHAWVGWIEEYAAGLLRVSTHDGPRFCHKSEARFVTINVE